MANNISNGKSLSENIKSIMDAKVSDRTKKRSLIKLGLRQHEVEFIFAQAKMQGSGFDFAKLTFGVEIEAYGFTRQSLINAAATKGLEVRSESYNHEDTTTKRFKIVSDGSLTGENSNEVVSPILNGENGLNSLKTLCDALATVGAQVNRSCGLHVHIGAAAMSDEHYIRIYKNYQAIEKAVDTFMPTSRRASNNGFCLSLQGFDFSRCSTKIDVCDMMHSRYYKINSHAYFRHSTIEFRQHSGTTDFTKIENWVRFLAKLVDYSYKHTCPVCHTIEEIPFLTDAEKQFFISRRNALN